MWRKNNEIPLELKESNRFLYVYFSFYAQRTIWYISGGQARDLYWNNYTFFLSICSLHLNWSLRRFVSRISCTYPLGCVSKRTGHIELLLRNDLLHWRYMFYAWVKNYFLLNVIINILDSNVIFLWNKNSTASEII